MQSILLRCRRRLVLLTILASLTAGVSSIVADTTKTPLTVLSTEIEQCAPVVQLGELKQELEAAQSPIMRQVFAWLFPFGPGWNSARSQLPARRLRLSFTIDSVPNFILAFIPAQINTNTLNTMTAFATGGLLSDVFLHLVPHSFMGEHQGGGVHFVMVEEKRNILIGLGIFVGFASFFLMEKTLRVLGSEDGHAGHSHSHSHGETAEDEGKASGAAKNSAANELRARSSKKGDAAPSEPEKAGKQPSKLSAYLNLFGDFVHNMMAASFYSSPLIGATTTLACFAHEIPHEIADYSILVRSGFTKKQAMQSQFLTAVGATFMGIGIHNLSASDAVESGASDLAAAVRQAAAGILGTTVQLADLVIPFVAGGFMYIGAVAVLPTLLEESSSGKQALREFAAMAFGVACMFMVAYMERVEGACELRSSKRCSEHPPVQPLVDVDGGYPGLWASRGRRSVCWTGGIYTEIFARLR
ncbi:ZIP zinc transporter-domain-containing protein [Fomitopsis serialis]|uniref:ZIP zinc transporter-domain-containing protein n=1 Tax=Fomitopsis serialis TaxID=139415 RepID=UPI0020084168|nr:ZIP zinc transporter-domain-containing protein [Neoantrodia serialis]KAH9929993.1 ZIP zinc transporter-domain-containing protein [Neoantrodia serialis]